MELLSKIKLSWHFGKLVYIISGILTVGMAVLVVFRPLALSTCIAIKVMSIPVIYYLNASSTKEMTMYFYLNLGISRREYHFMPFVVDLVLFILLMLISSIIGYAIR